MPFTFAHPAFVIPLLRQKKIRFSATGLIVGSIAPDFESFLKFGGQKTFSHTWLGMFWFDLPMAFFIALVFHLFIRDAFIDNLPGPIQKRFINYRGFDFLDFCRKNTLTFVFSLLIGILSHLLSDGFTHLNFYHPDDITSRVMIWHWHVFILIQYFTSALGLLYVFYSVFRISKKLNVNSVKPDYRYWLFILLMSTALASITISQNLNSGMWVDHTYIISVILSAIVYSLFIASFFFSRPYKNKS